MSYPFEKIKEHYEYLTPIIISRSKEYIRAWTTPYSELVEWNEMFSPIEEQAWQAIRCFGKVPLYPQYPVGKYFVDFGNPFRKIAVECDGKQWHLDKGKDIKRDLELEKLGWRVYRISGSDCVRPIDEYYDLDILEDDDAYRVLCSFYSSTIEGLLKAIAILHFHYEHYAEDLGEYDLAVKCLKSRVLI